MSSEVDHPQHYNFHPAGIECIEVVEHFNFNVGNAIKYVWRAGLKSDDRITDLQKAIWYLQREIERIEQYEKVAAPKTQDHYSLDGWQDHPWIGLGGSADQGPPAEHQVGDHDVGTPAAVGPEHPTLNALLACGAAVDADEKAGDQRPSTPARTPLLTAYRWKRSRPPEAPIRFSVEEKVEEGS